MPNCALVKGTGQRGSRSDEEKRNAEEGVVLAVRSPPQATLLRYGASARSFPIKREGRMATCFPAPLRGKGKQLGA